MARSFAFRYEGLRQQEKLLRAVGAEDKGTADALGRRIETVEQSALELGFMPLRGKRNQIIGIGCVMPSITDLAATVLNREEEYRLFSAVAHAHFWALNQLSLYACDPPVDAEKGTRNFVHGSGYLEKHLSATSTMFVVSEVLDYLSRIVWARFALFGWAIDDLRRTLEEIYDAIGLSISPRFWRKNV